MNGQNKEMYIISRTNISGFVLFKYLFTNYTLYY